MCRRRALRVRRGNVERTLPRGRLGSRRGRDSTRRSFRARRRLDRNRSSERWRDVRSRPDAAVHRSRRAVLLAGAAGRREWGRGHGCDCSRPAPKGGWPRGGARSRSPPPAGSSDPASSGHPLVGARGGCKTGRRGESPRHSRARRLSTLARAGRRVRARNSHPLLPDCGTRGRDRTSCSGSVSARRRRRPAAELEREPKRDRPVRGESTSR